MPMFSAFEVKEEIDPHHHSYAAISWEPGVRDVWMLCRPSFLGIESGTTMLHGDELWDLIKQMLNIRGLA
ncbi:hypothetical protein [Streptomyces sp. NPDC088752]|uniref:hypothetical protein n=1 Tax=Streptomyces sp. NPDC088752 TaxID=3154963 RepID=UPI00342072BB